MYSIPSLNRHLWGFSKVAVYPVWQFKEVSNVGVRIKKKRANNFDILICVGVFDTLFHSIDYTF